MGLSTLPVMVYNVYHMGSGPPLKRSLIPRKGVGDKKEPLVFPPSLE